MPTSSPSGSGSCYDLLLPPNIYAQALTFAHAYPISNRPKPPFRTLARHFDEILIYLPAVVHLIRPRIDIRSPARFRVSTLYAIRTSSELNSLAFFSTILTRTP